MATTRPGLAISLLCVCHVTAVLFGVSAINQFIPTLLWSSLMTCLLLAPPLVLLPWQPKEWIETFLSMDCTVSIKKLYCRANGILVVLGSWVGAFVILLDWNEVWQVWPIPCCIGSILGSLISLLIVSLRLCCK